jgi:hypothetical protein
VSVKVIDPWGKILLNLGVESPTFGITEIDLDYLDEVRHSMPIVKSFRDDLYLQLPLTKSTFFYSSFFNFKIFIYLVKKIKFLRKY